VVEQVTVPVGLEVYVSSAEGIPQQYLVRGQDRALQILLQRVDDAHCAEAVATDEDGVSTVRRVPADPVVQLWWIDASLVAWQRARCVEYNVVALRGEVLGAEGVE